MSKFLHDAADDDDATADDAKSYDNTSTYVFFENSRAKNSVDFE